MSSWKSASNRLPRRTGESLTRDQTSIAVVPALVATQNGGIDTLPAVAAFMPRAPIFNGNDSRPHAASACTCPHIRGNGSDCGSLVASFRWKDHPRSRVRSISRPRCLATTTLEHRCRPDLTAPYVAPRTKLETDLVNAWTEALYMDGIGIHDNFFELGGHSLQATILLNHLQDRLGQAVPGHASVPRPVRSRFGGVSERTMSRCGKTSVPGRTDRRPDDGAFDDLAPIENGHHLAGFGNGNGGFSIPRLARDQEAEDLLARIDELENEEVEALLGSSATNGEVRHE